MTLHNIFVPDLLLISMLLPKTRYDIPLPVIYYCEFEVFDLQAAFSLKYCCETPGNYGTSYFYAHMNINHLKSVLFGSELW